jgi:hypothetical protein
MGSEKQASGGREKPDKPKGGHDGVKTPDWSNGLRKLYDSVVDEPLPDSFKDLLSKLDESGSSGESQDDGA